MEKKYLSANELLKDAFQLAIQIYQSGWRPDLIIGIWRGGTPVAMAIHEYFDYVGILCEYGVIRTSSYLAIEKRANQMQIQGLYDLIKSLDPNLNVLFVDDVFDTGRSIDAILSEWTLGIGKAPPNDIKIACPWYKPSHNLTTRIPDYFLHKTEDWLVFPHELKGLTKKEILLHKSAIANIIFPK
jgi:uncharacterized protein